VKAQPDSTRLKRVALQYRIAWPGDIVHLPLDAICVGGNHNMNRLSVIAPISKREATACSRHARRTSTMRPTSVKKTHYLHWTLRAMLADFS